MFQLKIEQEFQAPVSKLFDAWSKPEFISKWFAPGDMTVPEASVDFREGGEYRIIMEEPSGEQYIVGGKYLSIKENDAIEMSWKWEHGDNTTKVIVSFEKIEGNKSKLVLDHSEFVEQEHCDHHHKGWVGCLANLQKAV